MGPLRFPEAVNILPHPPNVLFHFGFFCLYASRLIYGAELLLCKQMQPGELNKTIHPFDLGEAKGIIKMLRPSLHEENGDAESVALQLE